MDASQPSHFHEPSAPPPPFPYNSNGNPAPTDGFPANPTCPPIPHLFVETHTSPVPWSTGLCSCFDDCRSCCLTFWCPCISFGRIAEIVDRGSPSCGVSGSIYTLMVCLFGCACMYSCFYRSKMRGQYFLKESPCIDCCVHLFCEGCALCQEYRELQNRGFDMSIGWYGNMERQRQAGVEWQPVVPQSMTR